MRCYLGGGPRGGGPLAGGPCGAPGPGPGAAPGGGPLILACSYGGRTFCQGAESTRHKHCIQGLWHSRKLSGAFSACQAIGIFRNRWYLGSEHV